jgi:hypothetical protein
MHPIMFVLFLRRPNQPIPVVINTTRVNSITYVESNTPTKNQKRFVFSHP